MLVLLVTNRRDLTTDFLIRELNQRKIHFFRLNTDIITEFSITIDPLGQTTSIEGPNFTLNTNDISVAYYRRPLLFTTNDTYGAYQNYIQTEWGALLNALYRIIGHRWFSHPINILRAGDKSRQLSLAHEIGFSVPKTIFTNNYCAAKKLQSKYSLVAKPMKQALIGR